MKAVMRAWNSWSGHIKPNVIICTGERPNFSLTCVCKLRDSYW